MFGATVLVPMLTGLNVGGIIHSWCGYVGVSLGDRRQGTSILNQACFYCADHIGEDSFDWLTLQAELLPLA